jgi:hypothetical protein
LLVGYQLQTGSSELKALSAVVFPSTPPAPQPKPVPAGQCVETERGFRRAITNCDQRMNESSCVVDICSTRLSIPGIIDPILNTTIVQGIDTSNKNIIVSCEESCKSKRCIFDGLQTSRLFYGSYTNITFLNFIFTNGFHPNEGGAIQFDCHLDRLLVRE